MRRLSTGGAWLEQARCAAPALVAADLLRDQHRPMFLCHDIWSSPDAYAYACGNRAVGELLNASKQMADDSFELGAFAFPTMKETAATTGGLKRSESLCPIDSISTAQLEEELCDAAILAIQDDTNSTAAALAQIDDYFAHDDDGGERRHRQSLLGLLRLLRPNLADLLGEPSSLGSGR